MSDELVVRRIRRLTFQKRRALDNMQEHQLMQSKLDQEQGER